MIKTFFKRNLNKCWNLLPIQTVLGFCLFLRYSDVDAYDCKRFIHGCPDADYYSDEIYKCKRLNSIVSKFTYKLPDKKYSDTCYVQK